MIVNPVSRPARGGGTRPGPAAGRRTTPAATRRSRRRCRSPRSRRRGRRGGSPPRCSRASGSSRAGPAVARRAARPRRPRRVRPLVESPRRGSEPSVSRSAPRVQVDLQLQPGPAGPVLDLVLADLRRGVHLLPHAGPGPPTSRPSASACRARWVATWPRLHSRQPARRPPVVVVDRDRVAQQPLGGRRHQARTAASFSAAALMRGQRYRRGAPDRASARSAGGAADSAAVSGRTYDAARD